jgi:hypothetical protein
MLRFRRMRTIQKFASVHASVHNHFNQQRSLVSVRSDRSAADRVGRVVSALDSGQYGVFGGSANETALD